MWILCRLATAGPTPHATRTNSLAKPTTRRNQPTDKTLNQQRKSGGTSGWGRCATATPGTSPTTCRWVGCCWRRIQTVSVSLCGPHPVLLGRRPLPQIPNPFPPSQNQNQPPKHPNIIQNSTSSSSPSSPPATGAASRACANSPSGSPGRASSSAASRRGC